MIDFMVVGLPRSGTTWASAWLTTDTSLCWHDPLYQMHYTDWDERLARPGKSVGVSCTGIWRWIDWLCRHPARKVILHRDIGEVMLSMAQIGLPHSDLEHGATLLEQIDGLHVPFSDLFDLERGKLIWEFLMTDKPYDVDRHKLMIDIEMQPKFSGLTVNKDVTRKLVAEIMDACNE